MFAFVWAMMSLAIWCLNVAFTQKRLISSAGRLDGTYVPRCIEKLFVVIGVIFIALICGVSAKDELVFPAFVANATIFVLLAMYFTVGWKSCGKQIIDVALRKRKSEHAEYIQAMQDIGVTVS
jgi:O-antigen/teichoic acid export membrane protein